MSGAVQQEVGDARSRKMGYGGVVLDAGRAGSPTGPRATDIFSTWSLFRTQSGWGGWRRGDEGGTRVRVPGDE